MTYTYIMNSSKVKATFKEGKKKWFGEFTKSDYKKGHGWNQWGAHDEMCESVPIIENLTNEWIERYGKPCH